MMNWLKLVESDLETLPRGTLLKFHADYPFEGEVVMMVCEGFADAFEKCLITVTGHKAGINCYVIFPKNEIHGVLSKNWLIENWNKWVWQDCDVNDVLVKHGLQVSDIG